MADTECTTFAVVVSTELITQHCPSELTGFIECAQTLIDNEEGTYFLFELAWGEYDELTEDDEIVRWYQALCAKFKHCTGLKLSLLPVPECDIEGLDILGEEDSEIGSKIDADAYGYEKGYIWVVNDVLRLSATALMNKQSIQPTIISWSC